MVDDLTPAGLSLTEVTVDGEPFLRPLPAGHHCRTDDLAYSSVIEWYRDHAGRVPLQMAHGLDQLMQQQGLTFGEAFLALLGARKIILIQEEAAVSDHPNGRRGRRGPASRAQATTATPERTLAPDDETFRVSLRSVLERSGRSMRGLSAALGRDPGYVAALLDPTRPSRARPTPSDLLTASDATGIRFVELLELLWGIPVSRLANEVAALGLDAGHAAAFRSLTKTERAMVMDFVQFLAARQGTR